MHNCFTFTVVFCIFVLYYLYMKLEYNKTSGANLPICNRLFAFIWFSIQFYFIPMANYSITGINSV